MSKKDKSHKKTSDRNKPPISSITPKQGSPVSKYVSFVMLLVTILVFCFFFYNVIKVFLLPLFLAVLLAVIFRPLHQWIQDKLGKRKVAAAALATSGIMLSVLVPMTGLVFVGLHEANHLIRERDQYIEKAESVRMSVGLQKPFADPLQGMEATLRDIDEVIADEESLPNPDELASQAVEWEADFDRYIIQLQKAGRDAAIALLSDLEREHDDVDQELQERVVRLRTSLEGLERVGAARLGPEFATVNRDAEKRALRYLLEHSADQPESGFVQLVEAFSSQVQLLGEGTPMTNRQQVQILQDLQVQYEELRTALLGGPIWMWAIELANPSQDVVDGWISNLTGMATRWLPSITNTATTLITRLLMGLCIMAIALFYFFLDGATMVNTFMRLSPLDDRHELELLQEFDRVSRAVVLATLLSALAQGILGGIGYKLVGLTSVFLLTLLTTVLALIPFVGAAAVWAPACIYIALFKEPVDPEGARTWMYAKAGFLAAYGVLIISMADNVIKPWVLQGQSKLHPLLALLSVLGGVQALGPIGILIGPMVVAFLQVLLTILQREIQSFEASTT